MAEQFDLIVIGGGPGGYVAAIRGAQYGMKVALVEARHLGGTCLNRGCIPTKTLVHATQLYREIREGAALGIFAEGLRYDLSAMYRRKDAVVSELRDGIALLLAANGVAYYRGRAFVSAADTVKVEGAESFLLTGARILIATGASPQKPPIPGIELPGVFTSEELLGAEALDCKRLCVIGGGVIGSEIASVYEALGCEVSIIEAADRLLPTADREIGQNLSMIFKKRGVAVHMGSSVQGIAKTEDGLCVRFASKKGAETIPCEAVLLSVGRRAKLDGLWSEMLPIETRKGIVVNERFETAVPGVYAIGDCIDGGIQLAHVAAAQATCAVEQMVGEAVGISLQHVPACIYTNPEIAWVGLTADEAKRQGRAVKTSKYIMSGNGKSVIERQERGFVKLVFDAEDEVLVGAQLMCGRATDLIGELTSAIVGKRSARELACVIRPHPTFGEGVGEAVEDLFSRAVHIAPKRKSK